MFVARRNITVRRHYPMFVARRERERERIQFLCWFSLIPS